MTFSIAEFCDTSIHPPLTAEHKSLPSQKTKIVESILQSYSIVAEHAKERKGTRLNLRFTLRLIRTLSVLPIHPPRLLTDSDREWNITENLAELRDMRELGEISNL